MKDLDNLTIFENAEFGKIRVLEINNEPWFVVKDLCIILELANPTMVVNRLDEDERAKLNLGRQGETNIVNEYGLYNLILASRKPTAKNFKRWITHEVLPSIRKNGGYIEGQEDMTDEELLAKALDIKDKILAARDKRIAEQDRQILDLSKTVVALNETIEEKESQVVIYKERSKYFEEIINQPDAMTLEDIMANFGLSAQRGNRILYIFGVIKDKGDWKVTTKYSELGITTRIPVKQVPDKFGNMRTIYHTYYNQRGSFFIYMILKNMGIKPTIESNSSDKELALETIKEIDRIWKRSNNGKDKIFFRDIKDRIKEGFKVGVEEFISNLKEGNINELKGDDSVDISKIKESDYDMVDFYIDG